MDEDKSKEKEEQLKKDLSELRKLLKKGEVRFTYKKKDGTVRNAKGTLKKSLIPEISQVDDRMTKKSDDVFYYYDLSREDWRCFIKTNFKKIKQDKDNGKESKS